MTHDTSMIGRTDAPRRGRDGWRYPHLAALTALTWYATALGWQAQLVSYPLFRVVPPAGFPAYHLAYNEAIPWVVIVPGFVSFLACAAFPWTRPREVSRPTALLVAATGVGAVLTTALWAIPRHDELDRIGPDPATVASLLHANAWRTGALTVGAVLLLGSVCRLLAVRVRPAGT